MVWVHAGLLILGLVLLVKGSDFFVEASARIAKKLAVSEFIIGLTLVAIGTSIPELASSIVASLGGHTEIVIGNVIGSNIANIALIMGFAALVAPLKTDKKMLTRDGYILVLITVLFFLFMLFGEITFIQGIVFLLLYIAYLIYLIETKDEKKDKYHLIDFIKYFLKLKYLLTIRNKAISHSLKKKSITKVSATEKKMFVLFKEGLMKDIFIVLIGIMGVIIGAQLLIENAVWFAQMFDISENLIGLSIVAIGTSLPELSVSLSAARKGFGTMIIGNIIGSNIANILLITGVSSLITGLVITETTLLYTAPFLLFITLLLIIFIRSKWQVRKIEGIIFLSLYALFMFVMFFSGLI